MEAPPIPATPAGPEPIDSSSPTAMGVPIAPGVAPQAQAQRPRPALPYTSRAMTSGHGLSTTVTAARLKLAAALY
jgi:hypothetical protein